MMSEDPREKQFIGFARLLFDDLRQLGLTALVDINNMSGNLDRTIELQVEMDALAKKIIARRAYDLMSHVLWHSTPASGSTIKKYRGLTIEEIANTIPDLKEWPKESGE